MGPQKLLESLLTWVAGFICSSFYPFLFPELLTSLSNLFLLAPS